MKKNEAVVRTLKPISRSERQFENNLIFFITRHINCFMRMILRGEPSKIRFLDGVDLAQVMQDCLMGLYLAFSRYKGGSIRKAKMFAEELLSVNDRNFTVRSKAVMEAMRYYILHYTDLQNDFQYFRYQKYLKKNKYKENDFNRTMADIVWTVDNRL